MHVGNVSRRAYGAYLTEGEVDVKEAPFNYLWLQSDKFYFLCLLGLSRSCLTRLTWRNKSEWWADFWLSHLLVGKHVKNIRCLHLWTGAKFLDNLFAAMYTKFWRNILWTVVVLLFWRISTLGLQVAGGTGITPMLQVIDAIVSNPEDNTQVQRLNFYVARIPFLLLQKFSLLVCRNEVTLSWLSGIWRLEL